MQNSRRYIFKCQECGEGFTSDKQWAAFCRPACRKEFNNRRAMRGAELYDLVMIYRYERKLADRIKGFWNLVWRLCREFRDEDEDRRAGRRSWRSLEDIQKEGRLTRLSYLDKGYIRAGR